MSEQEFIIDKVDPAPHPRAITLYDEGAKVGHKLFAKIGEALAGASGESPIAIEFTPDEFQMYRPFLDRYNTEYQSTPATPIDE